MNGESAKLKKGDRVAIVNCTAGGVFFVEGFAKVVAAWRSEDGQTRVQFEGKDRERVWRFVDPAAQADPYEFVSRLNLQVREAQS